MECLFQKKFGTPVWSWQLADNSSQRSFLQVGSDAQCQPANMCAVQGWAQDPSRDATLEYRLSVYHAKPADTGLYICSTPNNQTHGVSLAVRQVGHTATRGKHLNTYSGQVSCPRLVVSGGVEASSNRTSLGARVTFSCGEPLHSLVGEPSLTCLPSGRWSHTPPTCLKVRTLTSVVRSVASVLTAGEMCGHLPVGCGPQAEGEGGERRGGRPGQVLLPARPQVTTHFCLHCCTVLPSLTGPSEARCLSNSSWSLNTGPTCSPVSCPALQASKRVKVFRTPIRWDTTLIT